MYRYQYPMLNQLGRALKMAWRFVVGLILLVLAAELLRIGLILRRIHPWAGWAFAAAVGMAALWVIFRWVTIRARNRALHPPPLPPPGAATHADMKLYCGHLIHLLKRLGTHDALPPPRRQEARQRAYDIEGVLGAHPMNDDLMRAITSAENDVLRPLLEELDQQALEIARYKMTVAVEDVVEPPFPAISPLVVLYHQITLISRLVDTYLSNPTLYEYSVVMRDVCHVVIGGDFFRIGQRLFEGVYVNSPPMGRATEDLGQALASIWLTWSVAQAAMHRCRSLRAWTVQTATEYLDQRSLDSLLVTRDTLISDVLPVLKLRIRHSVGPGVADAAGFSEQVVQGIAKSVDAVVQGLRSQTPAQTAQAGRRTQHGTSRPELDAPPAPSHSAGRNPRGVLRLFRTVGQRVHYSVRGPASHD